MTDVSLAGAFLAGLVSFLSPCVLPLVPGYISMLSGIGMEQLRQGEVPRGGLFSSALAFVTGFSVVFISFGATASAVGSFLKENRHLLVPIAGALILLFGLHLLGLLIKLSVRAGILLGALLVVLGVISLLRRGPLFADLGALHFFSLSIIGFFGPALARWLNRDVHLRSSVGQPGPWSGFLLGFAFAFGWTPCIGPILSGILIYAGSSGKVARGVLLLAVYSAGLAIPFLLTALGISRFMVFYKNFRKYLHAVELFSGAVLLFVGGLLLVNKLTWLAAKLGFLNAVAQWLERVTTTGASGRIFGVLVAVILVVLMLWALVKNWGTIASIPGRKTVLMVATVVILIVATALADRFTRSHAQAPAGNGAATTTEGTPAPDVTFKNLDDKPTPLNDYRGKVVLVNFWATWCEPCQVEIPWLIDMQQKYSSKGFTILGVDADDEDNATVSKFLEKERFDVDGQKLPMNYPILRASDAVADKFGGLLGYPTSFLISRDGKIVKKIEGLRSYDEIAQAIESQL